MMKGQIKFEADNLDYEISGRGRVKLLAFHGFGQSAAHFEPFANQLGATYTIYAFDVFFHGNSKWHDEHTTLSKSKLKTYIDAFLEKENVSNFVVCGYSMGGKFALACLELYPQRIKQIILIAPDGIKTSFWYSLATYPQFFRKLFKQTIKKPATFNKITKWVQRLGLLDKSILKFARSQMNTEANRRRVYMSWIVFRELHFDLNRIAAVLNEQKIPIIMITGSYDKIIISDNMMRLLKHVENHRNIVLETGHNKLIAESADFLAKNKDNLQFKHE